MTCEFVHAQLGVAVTCCCVSVDSVCPCDEDEKHCDMNCCCDRQCDEQQVALFTDCTVKTLR